MTTFSLRDLPSDTAVEADYFGGRGPAYFGGRSAEYFGGR